jgi:transcriptional regulator with PAS, ATPase and Fis domain
MIRILKYLDKISKTDSTVLLLGESGSGKEVLSKYIHEKSNRCSEPLIPVNCAAIPKDLLESEFYGYDKGAFTGALTTGKAGFFEMADRGTLFLDEIGELPIEMQSKLLRSIELGEFKRIGGTSVIRTDVRIIAATNQSLEAMVERKEFRRDLFYRLNVIPINIPPLRERKEDIIELAKMFLEMYLSENDSEILLNSQLINYLLSYDWPGNIRELKNVIERIAIDYNVEDQPAQHLRHFTEVSSHQSSNIKDQDLDEVDLRLKVKPYELSEEQPIQSLKIYMHQIEKNYLLFALDKCHWNIAETAKLLGIHRSLLYRKLAALDLHKDK